METIRSGGRGMMLGGGGVLLALLGATGGVLAGVLPLAALPLVWLSTNVAVLLGASALTKPAHRVLTRGLRISGDAMCADSR